MVDSAWVALSLVPHISQRAFSQLLVTFGSAQGVLEASADDLRQVKGIGAILSEKIAAIDLAPVEDAIGRWQAAGVHIVLRDSNEYPLPLTLLEDAPPTLFMRGSVDQGLWSDAVAIVGTRSPSGHANRAASAFASRYAASHYTVVSGMALGVDTLAHQGALSVPDGRTVAVLGSGVMTPYPSSNTMLADQILASGGTLICECSPDEMVSATRLVARNRLITGLSRFLLLIESSADGGAMHAVRFARQQQRPIYVCDLPASGNQQAIHQGADRVLRL